MQIGFDIITSAEKARQRFGAGGILILHKTLPVSGHCKKYPANNNHT